MNHEILIVVRVMNYDSYHSQKEQLSFFDIIRYIIENYIKMYDKLKKNIN